MPFEHLTEWILTGFFAFVLPLAGLLWFLLARASPRKAAPTPAPAIPAEFRSRRRRSYRYGFSTVLVGVAMLLSGGYLFTRGDLQGVFGSTVLAGFIAFMGLILFVIGRSYLTSVYCCPACGDEIADSDGWVFNARSCPSCKASFE